ncbi:MAG TPA: FKBP-type peptidyl-prolyl cis-trans isomerase [Candidatus Nanoarchaeia archaeon]|nr:FKBP-type peptidyl-prolyl cis-trans isomerase [Candidatus Nanoarchaeia archaeon]
MLKLMALLSILFIVGCSSGITSGAVIESSSVGDTVSVMYTLSLGNDIIVESPDEPLIFTFGKKEVLPAFEKAVAGMAVGDEKSFVVEPKDGYGVHRPDLIIEVSQNKLPLDLLPELGMELTLANPEGVMYQGRVIRITADNVTVDLNHPLVDETLYFQIKVVDIK